MELQELVLLLFPEPTSPTDVLVELAELFRLLLANSTGLFDLFCVSPGGFEDSGCLEGSVLLVVNPGGGAGLLLP